jgi:DNA polymerase
VIVSLDFETTSACDISLGSYRYAADPSTRILMFAIAKDDGEPVLWRFDHHSSPESLEAEHMLREAVATRSIIFAHSSQFEAAISRYRLLKDVGVKTPHIDQWRCTAAMARRAAIPVSLANAAGFLKLDVSKDTRGKALIGVFSDQTKLVLIRHGKESRKSASPILENPVPWDWTFTLAGEQVTVREAWDMFCEYCKTDVRVEQQLHKTLAKFELEGDELEGFLFTARMNDRGIPVNVKALANARVILDDFKDELTTEFTTLTGLQPTQTAKVLAWLRHEGYAEDNLQADTMESQLGSSLLTPTGQRALEIRSQLSFAAIKKVQSMMDTECGDGIMRGLFTWYGAQATGRWTSNGPQVQNAKKPTIEQPDIAYAEICGGIDTELFGLMFGNPYEAVASVIRNFIQRKKGTILAADFSNIESRVALLLAEQYDGLDIYREGRDAYKELASQVFGVPVSEVTKEQRFIGKVGVLSLVFRTGAKAFHETCATWGQPIEKKLACKTVRVFREENPQFPITWRRFDATAVKAINDPGKWFEANSQVSFAFSRAKPFHRLMMRLPSGRCLCYSLAKVERTLKRHKDYETGEVREWESDDIKYWGQLKGHTGWGWCQPSLFQNSVQATARDIMQHGCIVAERAGYEIFSIIHDEVLANDNHPDGIKGLEAAICTHPAWLDKRMPIAAAGSITPYYQKT